jgi:hypothetical protein
MSKQMKNTVSMSAIAAVLLCLCLFIGVTRCKNKPVRETGKTENVLGASIRSSQAGTVALESWVKQFNRVQLDSLCEADAIPSDLGVWMESGFRDYETGNPFVSYAWFSGNDGSMRTTYIVSVKYADRKDTLWMVEKRQTVKKFSKPSFKK